MIKLIFCVRRKAELSHEEFFAYWLQQHGPLVRSVAGPLAIRRYVQSHTLDSEVNALLRESRGAEEGYDGTAEVWWEDAAALEAALQSPQGAEAGQALLEDEARFIDLARSSLFLTEEHVVLDN